MKIDLIPRAGWNALPPHNMGGQITRPAPLAILHHSAADGLSGPREVRRIQEYHMYLHPRITWRDIAYKRLADESHVYEGRHLGTTDGATKGFNDVSASVCALGDFSARHPSRELLDNLALAVIDLWQRGEVDTPQYDGGHRNFVNTSCPGDHLYALIPEINRRAINFLEQEFPVDAVILIHPSSGTPDALAGLTALLSRPDQKIAVVVNVESLKEAQRLGKRTYAIGAPAADLVSGEKELRGTNRLDTLEKVLAQSKRGW